MRVEDCPPNAILRYSPAMYPKHVHGEDWFVNSRFQFVSSDDGWRLLILTDPLNHQEGKYHYTCSLTYFEII